MKKIIFPLLLFSCSLLRSQEHKVDSVFPESWDQKHELRGTQGKVLAWAEHKNREDYAYRHVLVYVSGTDSAGDPEFYLSEHYSQNEKFTEWNYSSIHYSHEPDSVNPLGLGYWDVHVKHFTKRPTREEINSVLSKWMFHLFPDDWITVTAGIDKILWKEVLGYFPEKDLY